MDYDSATLMMWIAIAVVLVFDYTNGFHDSSDMTASVIGSNAMTPTRAVLVASAFTFIGPLLGGTAVANTVGRVLDLGGVDAQAATRIVLAGVLGAVTWNMGTWWFGIPSSSSHALVGGLVGAALVSVGGDHVIWGMTPLWNGQGLMGFVKILSALIFSPVLGFMTAVVVHLTMLKLMEALMRKLCPTPVVPRRIKWGEPLEPSPETPNLNPWLKRAQYVTMSIVAFAHGTNDAQKSMGVIALLLLINGQSDHFEVPLWAMLTCSTVITLGTMSGGWRIVRTLAFRLAKLRPIHGLDAQLGAGLVIFGASVIGVPVSTTHVVSTSIMGVGAAEFPKRMRWAMAFRIALTWVITIPGSALAAGVAYGVIAWMQ